MTELPKEPLITYLAALFAVVAAIVTVLRVCRSWLNRILGSYERRFGPAHWPLSRLGTVEKQYRRAITALFGKLELKGIIQIERLGIRTPLESIYVELDAFLLREHPVLVPNNIANLGADKYPEAHRKEGGLSSKLEQKLRRNIQPGQRTPIGELLRQKHSFVLLGDPGCGKSTALKRLASLAAEEKLKFGSKSILPILIPLAGYAEKVRSGSPPQLEDYFSDYYITVRGVSAEISGIFENSLSNGRALVLLDGLDEVGNISERSYVAARVSDFMRWRIPAGNRVIVTSRINGYSQAPITFEGVDEFVIADFSDSQIREFARKWSRITDSLVVQQESESAPYKLAKPAQDSFVESIADGLITAIFDEVRITELASNPLLITILGLIFRQGVALPKQRVELYDLCTQTLISSWTRARSLDGRQIGELDQVETIKTLAPLAFWMRGLTRDPSRSEVVAFICKIWEKRRRGNDNFESAASRFVDDVANYCGLLSEKGPGTYGFIHLTFEEYLAAREIIFRGQVDKREAMDVITQKLAEPSWHEIIRLAVGYLGIVSKEEDSASLLIDGIYKSGLDIFSLLLAGECVRDIGEDRCSVSCFESVSSKLCETLEDSEISSECRWRAAELLGDTRDIRFEEYERLPEKIRITEQTIFMGTESSEVLALVSEVSKISLEDKNKWLRDYWTSSIRSEEGVHSVDVPSFDIGRFPITNAQYKKFIDSYPDYPVPCKNEFSDSFYSDPIGEIYLWDEARRTFPRGAGNLPVVFVDWFDAIAYCQWLTEISGIRHFLPSESQWTAAARGEQLITYPWGFEQDVTRLNCWDSKASRLLPVGCFPNARSVFGISDMVGHTWEWTSTRWGESWENQRFFYPYQEDDGREDLNSNDWRVVRGGAWDDPFAFCRISSRGPNSPRYRSHYIGFRVASVQAGEPSSV